MLSSATLAEAMPLIRIDDEEHNVIEIRATGDILLDVSFENTNSCYKSIPSDTIRQLRLSKTPFPSPRVLYRVRLDTLKKQSRYFEHLLGPNFAEGSAIKDTFLRLAESKINPSEADPAQLPRICIVDEDAATLTIGRELVFEQLLRVIHGVVC